MNPGIECTFELKKEKIALITLKEHPENTILLRFLPHSCEQLEARIREWMEIYLTGQQPQFCLPLDYSKITPFTLQVLHKMQTIPYGSSLSYQDIAQLLRKPLAARAVGQACGRNPFPIIIPCHRVLAKNQQLGGFSCGLPIKLFLLQHEGITFKPDLSPTSRLNMPALAN